MTLIKVRLATWALGLTLLHPISAAEPAPSERGSEAEQISHAREAVKQGQRAIDLMRQRLDAPDSEYKKAEADFQALDRKLSQTRLSVAKLRNDGKTEEADQLEATIRSITDNWQLARERFDIAIRERKVTQETIATLVVRVAKDQVVLDQMEGKTPAQPAQPATRPVPTPEGKTDPTPAAPSAIPLIPGAPVVAAPAAPPASTASQPMDDDPEVRKARRRVDARRAEQQEAENMAKAAKDRVRAMEKTIRAVDKMVAVEKDSVAVNEKAVAKMSEMLAHPPTDPAELKALTSRLDDTQKRLVQARERVQKIADQTSLLNGTLKELTDDAARANQDADEKRQTADAADAELAHLTSPLSRRNLVRWLGKHGPNLLAILCGMVALHLVVRQSSRQIVRLASRNALRGSPADRENRASTLVGVFRYASTVAIFGGGAVMLLDEAGVPIVPLMGGAAVLGLAVAFGAQNLIRDYFSGFMMLTEDQFSVNDVVRIGGVAGVVEKITLRMIVLRDLEGVRHFIPHGTVTNVSNLTHGWSRAMFDVPVAFGEDPDRVIGVLQDLARDLRTDPVFGQHILEDPEMLGIESLTDSKVVIRFLLKTRPLQQWPVRREMLRRIKKRFAELGIAMSAASTQTVFHRFPDGPPPELLALPSPEHWPARFDGGHEVEGPHDPPAGTPAPGRAGPRAAG